MNPEIQEKFTNYLDRRTSEVNKQINALMEDNRKDEADFEKIRANIFQIVKTIFQVSCRTCQTEKEQVAFLNSRLTPIADTWKKALATAESHNDEKRVLQEQTKLEVMSEARDTFDQLWKEAGA